MENIDDNIFKLIIERKEMLLKQARINYHKRTIKGTNKQLITGEKKKPGRKLGQKKKIILVETVEDDTQKNDTQINEIINDDLNLKITKKRGRRPKPILNASEMPLKIIKNRGRIPKPILKNEIPLYLSKPLSIYRTQF